MNEAELWRARADPATWAKELAGLEVPQLHTEWYDLMLRCARLVILGSRDVGKTVCACAFVAWWLVVNPGDKALLLSATETQAARCKHLVDLLVGRAHPGHLPRITSDTRTVFKNGSELIGSGTMASSLRGWHPALVVGDDTLDDARSQSPEGRRRVEGIWNGLIAGMGPTRAILLGSALHGADLLHSLKVNSAYVWRKYPILVPADPALRPIPGSLCTEASDAPAMAVTGPVGTELVEGEESPPAVDRPLGMWPPRPFGDPNSPIPEGPAPGRVRAALRNHHSRTGREI